MSPIERVLARTDRTSPAGCWTWQGGKTPKGYGLIKVARRSVSVHRLSYESHQGPIPAGMHVDHLCRNRACVNPDHLEAVTPQINVLRGIGLAAINATKTHCKRGHPFDEANTRRGSSGARVCKTCRRESTAARRRAAA